MQIAASLFTTTAPVVISGTPKIAVIVPAHNESAMIRSTVQSIMPQLGSRGRLLVVADNCTDDTALLAAGAGAEVTERRDERRIGKGYALDHGVKFLARTGPPDVVVIIDADCEIGAGTLDKLVRASIASGRPAQARNIIRSPAAPDTFDRISRFAWTVKTLVRPLGCSCLGLPCQLMGTGMALPWSIISSVNLATGHLAEDQKLTADLALMRKAALFCPEAQVTSSPPQEKEGRRIQRTRWEHGHLAVIVDISPVCSSGQSSTKI
jgi:glycosyltransferase involved in cell wall biosynthesis